MQKTTERMDFHLPKPVFLKTPADFKPFEESLKLLCERYLSLDWEWSFRVGGKVQQEMEENDPQNPLWTRLKKTDIEKPHPPNPPSMFISPLSKSSPFLKQPLISPPSSPKSLKKEGEKEGEKEQKHEQTPKKTPPPPPKSPGINISEVLSAGVVGALGKKVWQVNKLKEEKEERFFITHKVDFEESRLLAVRKEIWSWCVLCVEGEKTEREKLFCSHILGETDKWDIQHLYKNLQEFLQTENYKVYGERIERFHTAKPRENEDVFMYISRVERYVEEIEKLDYLAVLAGEGTMKPARFSVVWKVLSGIETYPEYKTFIERIEQMKPEEWVRLTVKEIREEIHRIQKNKSTFSKEEQKNVSVFSVLSNSNSPRRPPPPPARTQNIQNFPQNIHNPPSPRTQSHIRTPTPPRTQYTPQQKLEFFQCPSDVCLGFFRFGRCPRQEKGRSCKYIHTQRGRSRSPNNVSVGGCQEVVPPLSLLGGVVWEVWKFTCGCVYIQQTVHHQPLFI